MSTLNHSVLPTLLALLISVHDCLCVWR